MTDIHTALEMRETAAKKAKSWLEDWGDDLAATGGKYRDAAVSGIFNGRKINKDFSKQTAIAFNERAEAVHDCGELLAREIRALPVAPPDDKLRIAREALRFYAQNGFGCQEVTSAGEDSRMALVKDGGDMATRALAAIGEG